MLGLTKKELCEGICSEKTIGRLEANKTKPQIEVVRQLFERLNLSGEYQRLQVETQEVQAFSVIDKIMRCINNRDFEMAKKYLLDLDQYMSFENPINKQYKKRIEINLKIRQGIITKEKAREGLKAVLGYTMPYEIALRQGEKYLTNVEMQCLLDVAVYTGRSSMNTAFDALVKLCNQMEEDEGIPEHISAWEVIMTNIASIYGNIGEYDKSDAISLTILKESVHSYRINMLELNLYSIAWNDRERKKKNVPIEQGHKEDEYLQKCIALCKMNKNFAREAIMKKRFLELQEKKS